MTSGPTTTPVLEAIRQMVQAMPSGQIESLAAAIERLHGFDPAVKGPVVTAVASPTFRANALLLLEAWAREPSVPGASVTLALRAARLAKDDETDRQRVELVWTGPTTPQVPVRRTREVLLDLIRASNTQLTILSFAAYRVPEIVEALAEATRRGVNVRLVLETEADSQGRLSVDAAAAFETLTGMTLYIWPGAQRTDANGKPGTLHAKAAVADSNIAFVTSANLTGQALTTNMELGVLVRGGTVPGLLVRHVDGLIAAGVLQPVSITRA
ncbi:MAG: DISARM system phospholipase D-like protein DrmC [Dehalococcoidia bacterium]